MLYNSSIIFYHNNNPKTLLSLIPITQKLNLNVFECSTMNNLFETIKLLNPTCIITEQAALSEYAFANFVNSNKSLFIFVIGEYKTFAHNTIFCKDISDLEEKLINFCMRLDKNLIYEKDISNCNKFITKELEKLNFSIKHIGFHYAKEIVIQLYKSSSSLHRPLKDIYPYVSVKFNCNTNTIERAIRFAIDKAYHKCKEKDEQPYIFRKHPTVKQLTSFLLDKFLSSIV